MPTPNSPVTLSSDSEYLHDSRSFSDEDIIDDGDSSPKSPKNLKANKNKGSAKSSTKKTLEGESLKIEDEAPSTRKKLYTRKDKNGTLDILFSLGVFLR